MFFIQGNSINVDSLNDSKDFTGMKNAMEVCDFSRQDQEVGLVITSLLLELSPILLDFGYFTALYQPIYKSITQSIN